MAIGRIFSLFGEGGYTGLGGQKKVAGIVHAGALLFDDEAIKEKGTQNLARLMKFLEPEPPFRNTQPVMPSLSIDTSGCIEWLHIRDPE